MHTLWLRPRVRIGEAAVAVEAKPVASGVAGRAHHAAPCGVFGRIEWNASHGLAFIEFDLDALRILRPNTKAHATAVEDSGAHIQTPAAVLCQMPSPRAERRLERLRG